MFGRSLALSDLDIGETEVTQRQGAARFTPCYEPGCRSTLLRAGHRNARNPVIRKHGVSAVFGIARGHVASDAVVSRLGVGFHNGVAVTCEAAFTIVLHRPLGPLVRIVTCATP